MTSTKRRRRPGTALSAMLGLLLLLATGAAAANPQLKLPDFESLASRADESVAITLDAALLGMASRFLSADDPDDAAVKDIIQGLQSIVVRSYAFNADFVYPQADVESVRRQLSAPGWQKLVEVRKRTERTAVDIYISTEGERANGLAIIASEPRQFTIVNIVGSIDLDKLHKLEGSFGIPDLEIEGRVGPERKDGAR